MIIKKSENSPIYRMRYNGINIKKTDKNKKSLIVKTLKEDSDIIHKNNT